MNWCFFSFFFRLVLVKSFVHLFVRFVVRSFIHSFIISVWNITLCFSCIVYFIINVIIIIIIIILLFFIISVLSFNMLFVLSCLFSEASVHLWHVYMRFCRFDKTGAAADVWPNVGGSTHLIKPPQYHSTCPGHTGCGFFFVNWNEEIRHVSSVGCGTHDHHVWKVTLTILGDELRQ